MIVFAINKTPKNASFILKKDGKAYARRVEHKALSFDLNRLKNYEFEEDAMRIQAAHKSGIIFPPFSVNLITVPGAKQVAV